VAAALLRHDVLATEEAALLKTLAGYRNRLVHFYHEISADELFDVCAHDLPDIERMITVSRRWMQNHPGKIDQSLSSLLLI
jgi:uncharacterized protein YutE (UPF0331/DUF86 family)